MNHLKRTLSLLMSLVLLLGAVSFAGAEYDYQGPKTEHARRLSFDANGKLRILQIADIQDGWPMKAREYRLLYAAVKSTKPDLLMLTGDNIAGYKVKSRKEAARAITQVMDLLNRFNIPIAAVFGNHDDIGTDLSKAEQMDIYESYSNFIGFRGVVAEKTADETRVNLGTYHLPVYESADSDRVAFGIWCFDSGNYNPNTTAGGYGYVFPEQIEWYKETSDKLKAENGGVPLPSIAFQHIVPPQIFRALKTVPLGTPGAVEGDVFDFMPDGTAKKIKRAFTLPDGTDPADNWLREMPCPPETFFLPAYAELDAMLQQGDVMALFFGHDHINNYVVPYQGIDLVCTQGCTYQGYNDGNQGFRLITIDKNDLSSYETQTLLWQEVLEPFPLLFALERIGRFFHDLSLSDLLGGLS